MVLAARFGGTPWQWRWQDWPDPRDWGTAVSLMEMEAEQERKAANGS